MKPFEISSYQATGSTAHHASKYCVAAVLAALFCIGGDMAVGRAQAPGDAAPGAQVLTRGPVHEAFAGMVTFNPAPGVVIAKTPPEAIEEMPPEERPAGDNVSWIPGYWGWDDERSDFLWVSGTWRALPPGRAWMAGYWGKTPQGYQWTSGYWADATLRETTYLPPPPATVEVGPNIAAPSDDYGWSPGYWVWYSGRYAWSPGYWSQGRADWDWMPAHYVWTPRGYIFVGGYWDYPVQRRGILFAPVYFESAIYSQRGYRYSPTIVIGLGVFSDHLFLRPSYQHYYFGDYYAPSYSQGGFYASFSFQSGRYGYDPFYSRQHWEHRQDRDWERRVETTYQYRRDHETARPPRTWAAQQNIRPSGAVTDQNRMVVAAPIDQVAKRKDGPMRFQPVVKEERQKLATQGQEVQQSREQRRTLEATGANPTPRQSAAAFQPVKVEMPRSPIVAKPANKLGRNQSPPPVPKSPKPEVSRQPTAQPANRPSNVERSNPQVEPRQREPERKSIPGRDAVTPRTEPAPPKVEPRAEQSAKPTPPELPKPDRNLQPPATPAPEPRAPARAGQSRKEPTEANGGLEQKAPRGSEQPTKQRPAAPEKGSSRLLKNDQQREGNGKP